MLRTLSCLLGLSAIGVCGWAVYVLIASSSATPQQALEVYGSERDLGNQPLDEPIDVDIRLANRGDSPRRVFNLALT
jgi:hypothetical protein